MKEIHVITDHNSLSKEYRVIFKNGTVDWITIMDDKNKKVQDYLSRVEIPIELLEVSGDWMKPQWEEQNFK